MRTIPLTYLQTTLSVAVLAALTMGANCVPDEDFELQTLTAIARSNPSVEQSWLLPDTGTFSVGAPALGGFTDGVGRLQYRLSDRRIPYVFSEDLNARSDGSVPHGLQAGSFLVLPHFDASSPLIVVDGEPVMSVATEGAPPHDAQWRSFRVYDSGLCSVLVSWRGESGSLIPGFLPTFAKGLDDQIASCDRTPPERLSRISDMTLVPFFHTSQSVSTATLDNDDRIWVSSRYQAESIGGCQGFTFDLTSSFGISVDANGRFSVSLDGVTANPRGFCVANGEAKAQIEATVNRLLPSALATELEAATRLRPGLIGVDPVSCTRNSDCAGAYPGTGHTCSRGQCLVALHTDRVNVRPEGLELVVVDADDDPQFELVNTSPVLSQLCGTGRLGIPFSPVRRQGGLGPHQTPPSQTAAEICR